MSVPALRRPKFMETVTQGVKKPVLDHQYVIITLRDKKKLVLSSDAYNGILTIEDIHKCVFCDTEMELDNKYKEFHKNSAKHMESMNGLPYIDHYSENLVRQLNKDDIYCAICNVIVSSPFLARHIISEVHIQEFERASARVSAYTSN